MYFGVVGGEAQLRLPYVHLKKRKEKKRKECHPNFYVKSWFRAAATFLVTSLVITLGRTMTIGDIKLPDRVKSRDREGYNSINSVTGHWHKVSYFTSPTQM